VAAADDAVHPPGWPFRVFRIASAREIGMMPAVAAHPAAGSRRPEGGVMKTLAAVLVAVAVALVPIAAQEAKKIDITGTWEMTVESPQGQMVITANYKQEGETLTGTHVSEMGETPLKGTVKGADIQYTVTIDMGGQQMTIVHKAKVEGDTIKGSADIEGMGSITFTAKRKK
jgi:autotransporter translocation and assembly factor TamB